MSSKGTKTKIILNLLLLIVIFAIIYYLINQSFADIFAELLSTSVVVLAAAVILGTVYQSKKLLNLSRRILQRKMGS